MTTFQNDNAKEDTMTTENAIEGIKSMNLEQLRAEWQATFGAPTQSKDKKGLASKLIAEHEKRSTARKGKVKERAQAAKDAAPPPVKFIMTNDDGSADEVTANADGKELSRRRVREAPPKVDPPAPKPEAPAPPVVAPLAARSRKGKGKGKPAKQPRQPGVAKPFEHDPRTLAKFKVGDEWDSEAWGHRVHIAVKPDGFLATAINIATGKAAFTGEHFQYLTTIEKRLSGKTTGNGFVAFGVVDKPHAPGRAPMTAADVEAQLGGLRDRLVAIAPEIKPDTFAGRLADLGAVVKELRILERRADKAVA
jgi:hypothetical protein